MTDIPDRILELLGELRRRHDQGVLHDAEFALASTPDYHWPPVPGSAHPALTEWCSAARQFITQGDHHFLLPKPAKISYLVSEPVLYPEIETVRLDVHRCWGMAPYVGDPFVYTWRVAVDPHQRWIAEQEAAIAYVREQP